MSVAYIRQRGTYDFRSRPYYDYDQYTKGQFRALLAAEQLQMIGQYNQSQRSLDAAQCIWRAVEQGIHDQLLSTGNVTADAILRRCASLRAPVVRGSKISGIIQLEDCESKAEAAGQAALNELSAEATAEDHWNWAGGYPEILGEQVYSDAYNTVYSSCDRTNYYKDLLNRQIDKFGHHVLYAYEPSLATSPPVVATKGTSHQLAISRLSNISSIPVEDIKTWIRTGIMRANMNQGTAPMQPEITIRKYSEANAAGLTNDNAQIGLEPATTAAIIGIIKAITAAIGATVGLIQAMRMVDRQKFEQSINQIGLPEFGPQTGDWPTEFPPNDQPGSGQGGGGDILNSIDPVTLALLGGGLLLITSRK